MDRIQQLYQTATGSGSWLLLVTLAGVIAFLVIWFKYRGTYETPGNVADIVAARRGNVNHITSKLETRRGLGNYLTAKNLGSRFLNEFQFLTAAMTGCFLPANASSPRDAEYVFSTEAVRLACQAGARAFVLEVWPSPNGDPILQVVEEGSNWRRISMNSMPFGNAVRTIVDEVYGDKLNSLDQSSQKDVTILYLRFRGVPKLATYSGVAAALSQHSLHMLDPSFSSCRNQDNLVQHTSIQDLQGKLIVMANKTKKELEGTDLLPYVNVCQDSNKVEYGPADFTNLTEGDKSALKARIETKVTFSMSEDWKTPFSVGIQCIPMNVFDVKETDYFKLFETHSYRLKTQ